MHVGKTELRMLTKSLSATTKGSGLKFAPSYSFFLHSNKFSTKKGDSSYTARWDGSGRWESETESQFILPEKYGKYFRVPNPSTVLTKMICTLGPLTSTVEMVSKLINNGMSAARLNTAHGNYEMYTQTIKNVRQVAQEKGVIVPIILDTKGPEIRVGEVEGNAVELVSGCSVVMAPHAKIKKSNATSLGINYTKIGESVQQGDVVLLDNGKISLSVTRIISGDSITCRVIAGGVLKSNKGVNLPGCPVDLPHVTEKDVRDIAFAVSQNIEFIAHSFTRSAEGIKQVRALPGVQDVGMRIMAKIESQEGLDNFDEILREADGVMVARGDLGVEIPLERVCSMQKRIIRECNSQGKFVVTATEMLESMISNARPTRAEASDVANAVFDGTDCVMLSGETAVGQFPLQSVQVMSRICKEAELDVAEHGIISSSETVNAFKFLAQSVHLGKVNEKSSVDLDKVVSATKETMREAFAKSAVQTAHDVGATVIFLITRSGETARVISKYRPNIPVVALSTSSKICAQVSLHRSIKPILVPSLHRSECLPTAIEKARKMGLVKTGTRVLLLSGVNVNHLESFLVGEEQSELARSKTLMYIPGSFRTP